MRLRLPVAAAFLVAALALVALLVSGGGDRSEAAVPQMPSGFFGVAPQTPLEDKDAEYMKAGGIESVRVAFPWSGIQPTRKGGYDWSVVDPTIEVAARNGLTVLPFLAGTPKWLGKMTTLPVLNPNQRKAWIAFCKAAAKRYGPGGEFWAEHRTEGIDYEPAIAVPKPVKTWQIWNEANFFYFAYPVNPALYAQLVKISSKAIKSVQPGAKILLTGLFGEPTATGKRGMNSATFLERFYEAPGIKSYFDSIALHPYAIDTESLEEMVEAIHQVTLENHDRPGLYITEMGWGSQNNFKHDAFEQGPQGQVKQLRGAYGFLMTNQRRLNVKQVFWFSWKDAPLLCDFCDSVGFFRQGPKFKPKPAWRAFVALTGGRARP
ncbi:MAG TPA: beta-galactosidase [Solirubrobacterales bacterium]|nr:beta-galactosidase [Solirubrobacterales bacterium]